MEKVSICEVATLSLVIVNIAGVADHGTLIDTVQMKMVSDNCPADLGDGYHLATAAAADRKVCEWRQQFAEHYGKIHMVLVVAAPIHHEAHVGIPGEMEWVLVVGKLLP
jgi:hypothetical protein